MPNVADPGGSLASVSRGAMKTVIDCSVASGSAVSEGTRTIAAGLPPSIRSVNAFSMLKGRVCGRASTDMCVCAEIGSPS